MSISRNCQSKIEKVHTNFKINEALSELLVYSTTFVIRLL